MSWLKMFCSVWMGGVLGRCSPALVHLCCFQERYDGNYGIEYPPASPNGTELVQRLKTHATQLSILNQANAGPGTCVWVPPPAQGRGCQSLAIETSLGGMPWSCLPGEPRLSLPLPRRYSRAPSPS